VFSFNATSTSSASITFNSYRDSETALPAPYTLISNAAYGQWYHVVIVLIPTGGGAATVIGYVNGVAHLPPPQTSLRPSRALRCCWVRACGVESRTSMGSSMHSVSTTTPLCICHRQSLRLTVSGPPAADPPLVIPPSLSTRPAHPRSHIRHRPTCQQSGHLRHLIHMAPLTHGSQLSSIPAPLTRSGIASMNAILSRATSSTSHSTPTLSATPSHWPSEAPSASRCGGCTPTPHSTPRTTMAPALHPQR